MELSQQTIFKQTVLPLVNCAAISGIAAFVGFLYAGHAFASYNARPIAGTSHSVRAPALGIYTLCTPAYCAADRKKFSASVPVVVLTGASLDARIHDGLRWTHEKK